MTQDNTPFYYRTAKGYSNHILDEVLCVDNIHTRRFTYMHYKIKYGPDITTLTNNPVLNISLWVSIKYLCKYK